MHPDLAEDYIVQWPRFQVDEGSGCGDSSDHSVLEILLVDSWTVLLPLVSIVAYYRASHPSVKVLYTLTNALSSAKVAWMFYRQSRDINRFLQSNNSVSRSHYMRILSLASIDVVITLPVGIANIVLNVAQSLSRGPMTFYYGWIYDHTDWEPVGYSYAETVASGTSIVAQTYFTQWTSPILAFVIFGLFGVTSEARASYWRIICTFCSWFGWRPKLHTKRRASPLGEIEFGARSQRDTSYSLDIECVRVLSSTNSGISLTMYSDRS